MGYASNLRGSVTPYQDADKAALRTFQAEYFGPRSRQCDDAYDAWLFDQNPHATAGEPKRWICKRDGVVVGQQAAIPVLLKAGDMELRATWGIDLMVHRDWRFKGVAPAVSAPFERSADILLGLGISADVFRAYSRAGWADMGRLPFFARPLDTAACAQALHSRRWLTKLAPDVLLQGTARLAATGVRALRRQALEAVSVFDDRINAVWTTAAQDYPVLVKRDFASLRWRFDLVPGSGCYHRYYLVGGAQPLGYAVLRFDTWRGHRVARVVDYLARRADVLSLLALLTDRVRELGAAAVFLEHLHDGSQRALAALGFVRAGAVTQFIMKVQPAAAEGHEVLRHSAAWFITRADSDCDLPGIEAAGLVRPPRSSTLQEVSARQAPESSSA